LFIAAFPDAKADYADHGYNKKKDFNKVHRGFGVELD
jgi:hypothetical protein